MPASGSSASSRWLGNFIVYYLLLHGPCLEVSLHSQRILGDSSRDPNQIAQSSRVEEETSSIFRMARLSIVGSISICFHSLRLRPAPFCFGTYFMVVFWLLLASGQSRTLGLSFEPVFAKKEVVSARGQHMVGRVENGFRPLSFSSGSAGALPSKRWVSRVLGLPGSWPPRPPPPSGCLGLVFLPVGFLKGLANRRPESVTSAP